MSRANYRLWIGLILGLFVAVVAIGIFFWLKMTALKRQVVSSLENALGAEVQVSSLQLDIWNDELRAEGISLVNRRVGVPWKKGNIGKAVARFRFADLLDRTIPLKVEVTAWNLTLTPASIDTSSSQQSDWSMALQTSPGLSSAEAFRVIGISGNGGQVEVELANNTKATISGVSFNANQDDDSTWKTILKAASVEAGTFQAGAGLVNIQGSRDKINFSDLHFQCDPGAIDGGGEITLTPSFSVNASLRASSIPITMLVAIQWQMKLSGLASGEVVYRADNQMATASGHIDVAKGKCNLLPFLGKVASLVSLPDISDVEFDKATAVFNWKDHALDLSDIDVRKNDIVRMAGGLRIDSTGQVDGQIKLGFPSSVIAKWPALQEKIFSVQFEDFNWADVHLIGPPDHLQEDLTPRLLSVSTGQGGTMLNDAGKKAADLLNGLLNK